VRPYLKNTQQEERREDRRTEKREEKEESSPNATFRTHRIRWLKSKLSGELLNFKDNSQPFGNLPKMPTR
jgi:hypothetical protein